MSSTAGAAQKNSNQSIANFAASLSTAAIIFGVQISFFLVFSGNWKVRRSSKGLADDKQAARQSLFHKIYYYKTAFVPEKKRIAAPVTAIESFKNVFTISDRELVRVAGVDGYLFLQYLQLLLRIFIPMALVILPILLPLNRHGDVPGVSGLDSFAWPNVATPEKINRLWGHCIVAVGVICWVCFNFYLALRKFVRLRQTILTMPEHRIRASATTILVQSIPEKWLTVAALDALYDVFPGGIKDIWINRNYDDLQEKVDKRTKIARALEAAETNLIIQCTKAHKKMQEKEAKEAGKKQKTRKEKKDDQALQNHNIAHDTHDQGTDAGNPHEIEQQLREVLVENHSSSSSSSSSRSSSTHRKRNLFPIPLVGQGLYAINDGFRDVGQGVDRFGKKMVGGFKGAFGGKHDHHTKNELVQPNLDGSPELSGMSPTSADYQQRGASSDTRSPLREPESNNPYSDGTLTQTNSPKKDEKKHKATSTALRPFVALKNAYVGHGNFAEPQPFRKEGEEPLLEIKDPENIKYDLAGLYNDAFAEDAEDALWKQYIKPNDRDTMRLPWFKWSWWPAIPLTGKKVDTIYYCRKELARLNAEIADDQAHPERFPLMNSAFIQFNHQVAAHMACQSLSYHIPRQMAPRTVEVNPNYVMWENLTMKWWERYLRMFFVIAIIVVLIIFWGIPVAFTGTLSQIRTLTTQVHWLAFLNRLPTWAISFIQGVLPPAFLAVLFAVLPIVLRLLAGFTGTTTTGERELLVQNFYFAFVFVELFLVVSISTGITTALSELLSDPISIPATLARNLPQASNYFFSYMILQALSISSGTLLQIGAVVMIIVFRFFDTTPREKVSRVLGRPGINWGTMIPVYTNFGAIGIIYSVVSPLIIIMMLITFGLFWFTYRYQMIYVSYAKAETNGLLFPRAVNQLFTGLYFLELCLIGLFFIGDGNMACFPQAIIMIIMAGFTVIYQFVLNSAFGPLFTYLPITFEDEAVARDEEFQRAQASRWTKDDDEIQPLNAEDKANKTAEERELAHMEELNKQEASHAEGAYEMSNMDKKNLATNELPPKPEYSRRKSSWSNRSGMRSKSRGTPKKHKHKDPFDAIATTFKQGLDDVARPVRDIEAQVLPTSNLFDNIDDELEDIEPEARQKLIKRSFQHPAVRTIQPAVWVPWDELGVAKDEIQRTSSYTRRIWITSVNARLDAVGNVMYRGLPPDRDPFENMEV
ncbi:DUF221-domain-containing protein [Dothidotthia symphoricarpi CBS 119687]|uniref:DUF221-domain-containing protein n=1 Tax=Dothidotthia symphoricarpi CBS 119687 TaxID=1392245 RepID=A0A6A6A6J2_9PLEO|nr:DUF221-domain-containing protein [Dothidotthia symphoricarpi CBS 119687]KAF2126805.1 DUF221-domain-containing protein [Dothidotthia symphoricarpi CBS 119687]